MTTSGDAATAVMLQSIGGGGGYAGAHQVMGYTVPFLLREQPWARATLVVAGPGHLAHDVKREAIVAQSASDAR